MEGAVNITVDQYLLLGGTLVLFGLLGLRRGVNRELFTMLGIGMGLWLANSFGPSLVPLTNRLYKLVRLVLAGKLTTGDAVSLPDLIQTANDVQLLSVAIFGVILLAFYFWGQARISGPRTGMAQFLGLVAGGINGFLVAYYLYPTLLPKSMAVITLPSSQIKATLTNNQTEALVIVVFTILLIAFGLHNASRPRGDRSDRGDSGRRD